MKKNLLHNRKFKHGSVSVALTALIIVAVVIVNVIATALASNYAFMYLDMTSEKLYTLSPEAIELLDKSFVDIINKRVELNKELPTTNHGVAKDNVKTAENNLLVAKEAVNTAEKNVQLALINKVAFSQSVVHARSNYGIAVSNLELAKAIAENVAERLAKGEATEAEMTAASENLKIAEENMATATANREIAAENSKAVAENAEIEKYNKQNALKEGDEGYKTAIPYKELGEYKAFSSIFFLCSCLAETLPSGSTSPALTSEIFVRNGPTSS